jgi:hypothetical protein
MFVARKATSIPQENKLYNNPILRVLFGLLGISLGIVLCYLVGGLCFFTGVWYKSNQMPESLVVINQNDVYIAERASRFDLPQVIQQYDEVINAIEQYHHDQGAYPQSLSQLVPGYLPKVPGVYIKEGEGLTYSPETDSTNDAPFTFFIFGDYTYGSYPGDLHFHRFELKYCPKELGFCNEEDGNEPDDRERQVRRINDRWIWISRSEF